MKLLFTIPTLRQGGSERVVSVLANHLSDRHQITIITQDKSENCFYSLTHNVKQIHTDSLKKPFLMIKKLRKLIKELQPDVVISFLIRQNVQTLVASCNLGIPVIISERTSKPFYDSINLKILSRLGFFAYRFSDRLVVQTNMIKDQFEIIKNRTHVIANPIEIPDESKINDNRNKSIIAVGRLEKVKSYDNLIKAFFKISDLFPDWQLEIWGEGSEKENLQTLIDTLSLNNSVHLCGITQDIFSKLSQASIFAMPSRYEGFPNALCEAMAAELPVIYSNISGAEELVIPNETGILIRPDNIDGITEAITKLIQNPNLREKLGKNARSHIIKNFSSKKIVQQWEQLLHELI